MHSSACIGTCPFVSTTSCWQEVFPQAGFKWKLSIISIFLPEKQLMVFPGGGGADWLQGRRGHRTGWEEGQPGSHTSFPSMGSSSNNLKELTANSLGRHGIVLLIPAHHLQTGGKHCRKEQDPNRAPVVAMQVGSMGLRRAWEGGPEQRCYKLWAQQTHAISWGNCCTVVLNQAIQRTRWQIATRIPLCLGQVTLLLKEQCEISVAFGAAYSSDNAPAAVALSWLSLKDPTSFKSVFLFQADFLLCSLRKALPLNWRHFSGSVQWKSTRWITVMMQVCLAFVPTKCLSET